jgi:hypothetical protein
MNSSDYLSRKKYNISTAINTLNNNSVDRLAKSLHKDGNHIVTINPNISNSNIKYLYSIQPSNNSIHSSGNNFPLLIYNGKNNSSFDALLNDYSINKINYFLQFLKNDEYDKVFSEINTEETQTILYGLHKLKTSVSDTFGTLINLYESIFMSIKYFYFLYSELKSNETQCLKYKEDSEILNDINKLKEYIKQQQFNMNSVTTVAITTQKLNVKPEYLKYIQLYGIPYKMIFDPVLLQNIIDEMKP